MVKFKTPASDINGVYYFDENSRLKQRDTLLSTDNTILWSSIKAVTLEGTNFGVGNNTDGTGPVTISNFIPTGAIPTEIIPVFNTDLPLSFEQDMLAQIELYNDFGIGYNNDTGTWYVINNSNLDKASDFSLDNAQSTAGIGNDASWIIKFVAVDNVYTTTTRALNYYFSSILETRFYFSGHNKIFDPKTGKVVNDFINVLKTNTQPGNNSPLTSDIKLDIISQTVESDGFVNDFKVEVSYVDSDNDGVADNPDFFTNISQAVDLVFFQTTIDVDGLERVMPLASNVVNTEFTSATDPLLVLSSYPEGQIFYFVDEVNKFQEIVSGLLSNRTDMSVKTGRQDLQFQYKHNSSETQRINPGLTNIIDIFLVTDAYHTAYKKYVQDTTNTVIEPLVPTISELTSTYQSLQDNKMLSDNIVLNSVKFKPLFGNKASNGLRADISVIKVHNVIVSDSEIKSHVVSVINDYFDIEHWTFGDTFYFSELSAYLHDKLGDIVSSVVLVSKDTNKTFGDLYEIKSTSKEIFVNAITVDNVKVVTSLTTDNLNGVA